MNGIEHFYENFPGTVSGYTTKENYCSENEVVWSYAKDREL